MILVEVGGMYVSINRKTAKIKSDKRTCLSFFMGVDEHL
jgi:hypothetical protein